jgi:hypothetical protein
MKYTGEVYDNLDDSDTVHDATVTSQRIVVTFQEDGATWHISAKRSEDGQFNGHLGSGGRNAECSIELGVYKAKSGALILFGEWISRETGNSQHIVIRLFRRELPKGSSPIPSKHVRRRRSQA